MSNALSNATQSITFKPNGDFENFDQILVKEQICSMIENGQHVHFDEFNPIQLLQKVMVRLNPVEIGLCAMILPNY